MVKKLFKFVSTLIFLMVIAGHSYAQNDFTVSSSTDKNSDRLKPIQAGKSTTFQVQVTNNLSVYTVVSINTSVMGSIANWASVDRSEDTIVSGGTKVFKVTIAVPEGIAARNYDFSLALKAVDKNGTNRDYNYRTLKLMVDNTPPSAPTFNFEVTSNSVKVTTLYSWDANSSLYNVDHGGIESYTVALKKPDGTTVTQSIDAAKKESDNFTGLTPYTAYNASVTAIDLAGNSNTFEKVATTVSAAPTSLSFSNTSYIGTTLSWAASGGATGYDVYQVTGSTNTKLNTSPVTGTSYAINNLSPNTAYTFNVITISNAGKSLNSANATVTTLALPLIKGSSLICSSGSTFIIENLLAGYIVSWTKSTNLNNPSSSGSSAIFTANGNGSGWIGATITAPTGQVFELGKKDVWSGKPTILNSPKIGSCYEPTLVYKYTPIKGLVPTWSINNPNVYMYSSGYFCYVNADIPDGTSQSFKLTLTISGDGCDASSIRSGIYLKPTVDNCNGGSGPGHLFKVNPNPAVDQISISLVRDVSKNDLSAQKQKINNAEYEVTIFNIYGRPVFRGRSNQTKIDLNVSGWQKGSYFVKFANAKEVYNTNFLVE